MARLHGNIYKISENWYYGRIYNVLSSYAEGLDGHYIVVYKNQTDYFVLKYGNFGNNLVSINKLKQLEKVTLTENAKEFIEKTIINTIGSSTLYSTGAKKGMSGLWIFDETNSDYELIAEIKTFLPND